MPWQILIITSVVFYSLSTVAQKWFLRGEQKDPMAFSILFQLVAGLMIGLFGLAISEMQFPKIDKILPNLAMMILLYALGNIFLFKALQKIEASKFTVIFSSRGLFTIIASSILIGESPTMFQLLGFLCVILGIAVASLKSGKIHFEKYDLLALLAGVCYGLATTNDRILLGTFKTYPYVFMAFILPSLFTLPFFLKSVARVKDFLRLPFFLEFIILCALYAISAITFYMALKESPNSSQVASINLASIILIVVLSVFLLGEREGIIRKLFGAGLGFIGLSFLL